MSQVTANPPIDQFKCNGLKKVTLHISFIESNLVQAFWLELLLIPAFDNKL